MKAFDKRVRHKSSKCNILNKRRIFFEFHICTHNVVNVGHLKIPLNVQEERGTNLKEEKCINIMLTNNALR